MVGNDMVARLPKSAWSALCSRTRPPRSQPHACPSSPTTGPAMVLKRPPVPPSGSARGPETRTVCTEHKASTEATWARAGLSRRGDTCANTAGRSSSLRPDRCLESGTLIFPHRGAKENVRLGLDQLHANLMVNDIIFRC